MSVVTRAITTTASHLAAKTMNSSVPAYSAAAAAIASSAASTSIVSSPAQPQSSSSSSSTSSSSSSSRSIASTLSLLQKLQSHGLLWMKSVTSREQVTQAMYYYMTRLGIDASAIPPVIHIAGTKGKGSTAAFTESMLRHGGGGAVAEKGLKTGLYTSPHLVHVTERFQINGKPVDDEMYLRSFWSTWDALNDGKTFGPEYEYTRREVMESTTTTTSEKQNNTEFLEETNARKEDTLSLPSSSSSSSFSSSLSSSTTTPIPTTTLTTGTNTATTTFASASSPSSAFTPTSLPPLPGFNFLTIVAFKLFIEAQVDVIVLEVGLGGRLDATNILSGCGASGGGGGVVVCGITTLDFDHTELLGDTLPQIACEKAGIFKPGIPAVTVVQRDDALMKLCEIAAQQGTPLFLSTPEMLSQRFATQQPLKQQQQQQQQQQHHEENGETNKADTAGKKESSFFPPLGLDGTFQRTNAALAVALVDIFRHQRKLGRIVVTRDRKPMPTTAEENEEIKTHHHHDALSSTPNTAAAAAAAAAGETKTTHRRNSAFADTFSSSIPPATPGIYHYPPPPYVYDHQQRHEEDADASVTSSNSSRSNIRTATSATTTDNNSLSLLTGLATAKWPGRAHIVDLPSHRRSSTSTGLEEEQNKNANSAHTEQHSHHPLVRLYIDGAHTEKSMQEAATWYSSRAYTSKQQLEHRRRQRHVLLFYCGGDKDALSLILPLTALPPFTSVHIAPVPWALSPRTSSQPASSSSSSTPLPLGVLEAYLEKKRKIGDTQTIQEIQESMLLIGSSTDNDNNGNNNNNASNDSGGRNAPTTTTTSSASSDLPREQQQENTATTSSNNTAAAAPNRHLPYLQRLASLWTTVQTHPAFRTTRQRLGAEIALQSGGMNSNINRSSMNTTTTTTTTTPKIHASVLEALECIQREATTTESEKNNNNTEEVHGHIGAKSEQGCDTHVLVTGSLYLAGTVLETIGFKP